VLAFGDLFVPFMAFCFWLIQKMIPEIDPTLHQQSAQDSRPLDQNIKLATKS